MIQLSRLNGKAFYVNCDMIKYVEETPDTLITLISNEKFMVKERATDVLDQIVLYRRKIYQGLPGAPSEAERNQTRGAS